MSRVHKHLGPCVHDGTHPGDLHANPKLAIDEHLEQLTQLPICDVRDRGATLGHVPSVSQLMGGGRGSGRGDWACLWDEEPGAWETGQGGVRPLSEFPSEAATQYEDVTTRGHLTAWS